MSNLKISKLKKELEVIRKSNNGCLTPEAVLEVAESPNSPLHSYFCWNNDEAARKYRLHQAQTLIRSVRVDIVSDPKTQETVSVKSYVSLPSDRGKNGYREITEVLSEDDLRLELLESIQSEFETVKNKLKTIKSASVAISKAADKMSSVIEKERQQIIKKINKKK